MISSFSFSFSFFFHNSIVKFPMSNFCCCHNGMVKFLMCHFSFLFSSGNSEISHCTVFFFFTPTPLYSKVPGVPFFFSLWYSIPFFFNIYISLHNGIAKLLVHHFFFYPQWCSKVSAVPFFPIMVWCNFCCHSCKCIHFSV